MRVDVSAAALAAGFSNDPAGTHTSRTIMLGELRSLLVATRGDATYDDYVNSIVGDNALGKATSSTRQKSLRHLRELYALRSTVPAFAGLRALWSAEESAQALLAMLCSVARDPLLRSTAAVILDAAPGMSLAAPDFAEAVGHSFPGRFTPGVLARIGRNVASSWTQSGHLRGRARKIRAHAIASPVAVAYALYLGHLGDESGNRLFATLWARLLDASESDVRALAQRASRMGWVGYRASAGMTEVTFRHLDSLACVPGLGAANEC